MSFAFPRSFQTTVSEIPVITINYLSIIIDIELVYVLIKNAEYMLSTSALPFISE